MRTIILGGGGFIGHRLARHLLQSGGLTQGKLSHLTLVDRAFPAEKLTDPRLEYVTADVSDKQMITQLIQLNPSIIFHLAAVVSGEAEKKFDLGMNINFQASLQMLEACRLLRVCPRIVFASSCGVFGGDTAKVIQDDTGPKPQSSYGTQKAMVELLMNDYSRRGFVDARSLRLPTIAIRPGKPNAATSSFVSGIIREPLHGKEAAYPVPVDTEVWIQSPNSVVQNFVHGANLDASELGQDRVINLPGLTTTIREMIEGLEKLAGPQVTKLISHQPDAFLESIVLTWPPQFNPQKALDLGFVTDSSAPEIIRLYMEEEGLLKKS